MSCRRTITVSPNRSARAAGRPSGPSTRARARDTIRVPFGPIAEREIDRVPGRSDPQQAHHESMRPLDDSRGERDRPGRDRLTLVPHRPLRVQTAGRRSGEVVDQVVAVPAGAAGTHLRQPLEHDVGRVGDADAPGRVHLGRDDQVVARHLARSLGCGRTPVFEPHDGRLSSDRGTAPHHRARSC